jgi:hypothetical protein
MKPDRLYGQPHAERLETYPEAVWEGSIDGQCDEYPEGGWEIEEWTVEDPGAAIPSALTIVENIEEIVIDDGDFSDDPWQHGRPSGDLEIVAIAQQLHDAITAKVSWFQAGKKIATHRVTIRLEDMDAWLLGTEYTPMLDGEPMYRPHQEANE